jgi:hypothetical protein
LFRQRLVFEIDRHIGEAARNGNSVAIEQFALPLLRGGVIDLEDVQAGIEVAVGKGVKARAQQNILRDSVSDGSLQIVFGVAAAGDEEGAKSDREGAIGPGRRSPHLLGVGFAENRDGDWIVEHQRFCVVKLVRRPAHGDAQRGAGWSGWLHGFPSKKSRPRMSRINADF